MELDLKKQVFGPNDGELIAMGGDIAGSVRLLADPKNTGNTNLASMIQELHPGSVIPTHFHKKAEQIIYIIKGSCKVTLEDNIFEATSGTLFHIPMNAKHCIDNSSDQSLFFLEITTPTGFEGAFRDIAKYDEPKPDDILKSCMDNDINFVEES